MIVVCVSDLSAAYGTADRRATWLPLRHNNTARSLLFLHRPRSDSGGLRQRDLSKLGHNLQVTASHCPGRCLVEQTHVFHLQGVQVLRHGVLDNLKRRDQTAGIEYAAGQAHSDNPCVNIMLGHIRGLL